MTATGKKPLVPVMDEYPKGQSDIHGYFGREVREWCTSLLQQYLHEGCYEVYPLRLISVIYGRGVLTFKIADGMHDDPDMTTLRFHAGEEVPHNGWLSLMRQREQNFLLGVRRVALDYDAQLHGYGGKRKVYNFPLGECVKS